MLNNDICGKITLIYLFLVLMVQNCNSTNKHTQKEHTVCTMQHICTKRKLSKVHTE